MQCAAVKTHSLEIMTQPQKRSELNCNEHWYGAKSSGASAPPTNRGEIDKPSLAENGINIKISINPLGVLIYRLM